MRREVGKIRGSEQYQRLKVSDTIKVSQCEFHPMHLSELIWSIMSINVDPEGEGGRAH